MEPDPFKPATWKAHLATREAWAVTRKVLRSPDFWPRLEVLMRGLALDYEASMQTTTTTPQRTTISKPPLKRPRPGKESKK